MLPGASVVMTKTDTGQSRTVVTADDGAYSIPGLPAGPYELKITMPGFNTYVQEAIILQVGSSPSIDVTLTIGAVSEQVTVTAGALMVESRSTGVGQVIDSQRVTELPLNGRQATELVLLSGLATSAPTADLQTNKNYPTATISVAGGAANGITYIMDGGSHNDPFNNLNLPTPFPDALQEFKVETSSLPARYGHHAAAAVNVITKSGTNRFQGVGVRFHSSFPLQREELLRAREGQPPASAVRWHIRRTGASGTGCSSSPRIKARWRRRSRPRRSGLSQLRRCGPAISRRSRHRRATTGDRSTCRRRSSAIASIRRRSAPRR